MLHFQKYPEFPIAMSGSQCDTVEHEDLAVMMEESDLNHENLASCWNATSLLAGASNFF